MRRNPLGTDSGAARFIDPAVLARIDNLELLAHTVVDGFMHGLHRSPHLGLSLDFSEHRGYEPGDDIRRVDWRLYARTDRYYVKEFEADTNANFTTVLDVSRSMDYRSNGVSKLDYARYLAASLAYFSHRQRDRVGITTFDHEVLERVPPSAKHLEMVLHTIDRVRASRPGQLKEPLRMVAESARRRGIIALISDLYEEPEAVLAAVADLRARGNDVVVFHILDHAEVEFPHDVAVTIEDAESGDRMPVVPGELRENYRALVQAHIQRLSRLLGQNRIDYAFLDTSKPLDHALYHYLSSRERANRQARQR